MKNTIPEPNQWIIQYRKGVIGQDAYPASGNAVSSLQSFMSAVSSFTSSEVRLALYFGDNDSSPSIRSIEIPISEIAKIKLSAEGATTPSYFLGSVMSNYILTGLESIELEGVSKIGNAFGSKSLGRASVILPPTITQIGSSFISENNNFVGPIYVPLGIPTPTDGASLSVRSSATTAYANGITLTGPGAAAWKEALPDLDGPAYYRKLILAED